MRHAGAWVLWMECGCCVVRPPGSRGEVSVLCPGALIIRYMSVYIQGDRHPCKEAGSYPTVCPCTRANPSHRFRLAPAWACFRSRDINGRIISDSALRGYH